MYLSFFGLAEKPFSITPDPRYLYLSGRHAEALAHLVYGIDEAGGFIQLTGEVGTGKTTVIRSLLARSPKNAEIALILNPRMNSAEFMLSICEELGILVPDDAVASVKDLVDILNRYLLRAHGQGRRVVLIVDEAQNLTPDLLEQVRLLTNLETETQKLLQIILIGQPELRELLARNDLRQLAQRITGRYHLEALSGPDTRAYVKHRLRIAGATQDIFTPGALTELFRVSKGVPRLINIICDRALLGAYSEDRHRISAPIVRRAAGEVFGQRLLPSWMPWVVGSLSAIAVACGLWLAVHLLHPERSSGSPNVPSGVTTPAAAVQAPVAAAAPAVLPPAGNKNSAADIEPAKEPLAALLRLQAANTDLDGAYWRLFALWGARYVIGTEDPCTQALRQSLECLAQRTTADMLRAYNRPMILDLTLDGAIHHVVLTGLSDSSARLMIGEGTYVVPFSQLRALWHGDLVLLWRPPELDTRSLSIGMRGSSVQGLRSRLQRWRGQTPDADPPDSYDDSLQGLVRDFQKSAGLMVDGVAGLQTQVVLDGALAQPGSPVLVNLPTGG